MKECFFCKNSTYNVERADLIRKYLKTCDVCPECRKHWEAKLKKMEGK